MSQQPYRIAELDGLRYTTRFGFMEWYKNRKWG